MTDRPILFPAPMVRALRDGRKTQTRRVLKPQPPAEVSVAGVFSDGLFAWMSGDPEDLESWEFHGDFKAPFQSGDRLWVREAHAIVPRTAYRMSTGVHQALRPDDDHDAAVYREGWERSRPGRWRPSIHMPRWASRLTLLVTEVRVQRLQNISEEDARAEGIERKSICGIGEVWKHYGNPDAPVGWQLATQSFESLWDSINADRAGGAYAWDQNPWVTATTFSVIKANIDQATP